MLTLKLVLLHLVHIKLSAKLELPIILAIKKNNKYQAKHF